MFYQLQKAIKGIEETSKKVCGICLGREMKEQYLMMVKQKAGKKIFGKDYYFDESFRKGYKIFTNKQEFQENKKEVN